MQREITLLVPGMTEPTHTENVSYTIERLCLHDRSSNHNHGQISKDEGNEAVEGICRLTNEYRIDVVINHSRKHP